MKRRSFTSSANQPTSLKLRVPLLFEAAAEGPLSVLVLAALAVALLAALAL